MPDPPPIPSDPRTLEDLRSLLLGNADAMQAALGSPPQMLAVIDAAVYERRLRDVSTDVAALARLFLLGQPVARTRIERAVQPIALQALQAIGLVADRGDEIRPLVRVTPYEGILIVSDLADVSRSHDFVAGRSPAAQRVAELTMRFSARRALDLGTGSGLQALLASTHCDRVVAIDLNARALSMARFNASLNRVSNVEFREGSWFEPVPTERFDLIVANPPYVVSPDSALLYRDSGLPGDSVTMNLLRHTPAYLEEDGFALVMGNWIHGGDGDWRGPIEAALIDSGCDALFLKYATVDPPLYAAHWNAPRIGDGLPTYLESIDRWLDYDRRHHIEAISEGCIVLRKRGGTKNWVYAIEVPGAPGKNGGAHVLRLFEARDRRDAFADDACLLSTRFAPAPGLQVVVRTTGEHLAQRMLSAEIEDGVGFSTAVRPELETVLGALDGARPLRELSTDAEQMADEIRQLHELGLIVAT